MQFTAQDISEFLKNKNLLLILYCNRKITQERNQNITSAGFLTSPHFFRITTRNNTMKQTAASAQVIGYTLAMERRVRNRAENTASNDTRTTHRFKIIIVMELTEYPIPRREPPATSIIG